jgi:hypothetical protein
VPATCGAVLSLSIRLPFFFLLASHNGILLRFLPALRLTRQSHMNAWKLPTFRHRLRTRIWFGSAQADQRQRARSPLPRLTRPRPRLAPDPSSADPTRQPRLPNWLAQSLAHACPPRRESVRSGPVRSPRASRVAPPALPSASRSLSSHGPPTCRPPGGWTIPNGSLAVAGYEQEPRAKRTNPRVPSPRSRPSTAARTSTVPVCQTG